MSQGRPRKKEKRIHTYYELSDGKLKRLLKKCPRCGIFMAHHQGEKPRWACGKCSYTEFIDV